MGTTPLPLQGIRVLTIEHFVSGPIGTMLLGDWGAEVIRIEKPGAGDVWRNVNIQQSDGQQLPLSFLTRNRNKKCITLDMKSPQGRALFLELVKKSDVVWENMAPHVMKAMQLDYDVLREANPAIVYVSVSGFGHDDLLPSPYSERPAFDFITQAMSGLMLLPSFGQSAAWLGFALTDIVPGIMATSGLLLALRERDRTGKAQRVDISMYDVAAFLNEKNLALQSAVGRTPNSQHDLQNTNQVGTFKTSDGYVAVGIISDSSWKLLCREMHHPELADDPRLETMQKRTSALATLITPVLSPWIATQTRAQVMQRMLGMGIPVGPVQDAAEVLACPQLNARHMFVTMDTQYGPVKAVGNPVKLSGEAFPVTPPPALGEHTDALLKELLGTSDESLAMLRENKVI